MERKQKKREIIKRKLNYNQGISIFFGLFLFLVASVLSAVMLEGALTAMKSVEAGRTAEQNYLTSASAAKTIGKAITETKIVREKREVYDENNQKIEERTQWMAKPASDESEVSQFGEYLKQWMKQVTDTQMAQIRNLTVDVPELDTVNVTVTIRSDEQSGEASDKSDIAYDITAVFTCGEGGDASHMIMTSKGQVQSSDKKTENNGNTIMTTITEYFWNAQSILHGSQERTGEEGI